MRGIARNMRLPAVANNAVEVSFGTLPAFEGIQRLEGPKSQPKLPTAISDGLADMMKEFGPKTTPFDTAGGEELERDSFLANLKAWVESEGEKADLKTLSQMLSCVVQSRPSAEADVAVAICELCANFLEHNPIDADNASILVDISCSVASSHIRIPRLLSLLSANIRPILNTLTSSQISAVSYSFSRLNCYEPTLFTAIEDHLSVCEDPSASVVILSAMSMLKHDINKEVLVLAVVHIIDDWCQRDLEDVAVAKDIASRFQCLSCAVAKLFSDRELACPQVLVEAMSVQLSQNGLLAHLSLSEMSRIAQSFITLQQSEESASSSNIDHLFTSISERACHLISTNAVTVSEDSLALLLKTLCESNSYCGDALGQIAAFFAENFERFAANVEPNKMVGCISALLHSVSDELSKDIIKNIDHHIEQNPNWVKRLRCDAVAGLLMEPVSLHKNGSARSAELLFAEAAHIDKKGTLTPASATVFLCSGAEFECSLAFFSDLHFMVKSPTRAGPPVWDHLTSSQQSFFQSAFEDQGIPEEVVTSDQPTRPRSFMRERRVGPNCSYEDLISPSEVSADTLAAFRVTLC
eukprot:TRINITY_DN21617_c0_g1_i3.p1 TRINITY_DN21617_c0_g1~~TRINITY_DN21617_c0_g1_i3.p1  ORF type:complete len:582 (+),score=88.12 TRINITY_DN21617_c0_g1_i3:89-1834(+)